LPDRSVAIFWLFSGLISSFLFFHNFLPILLAPVAARLRHM
jgi:hypothetical protein